MFGLGSEKQDRCGLVVDVGSSSVALALVYSSQESELPQIIWSHREYSLLKDNDIYTSLKQVKTALVNCFLELGSNGLKTLNTYNSNLTVKIVPVAISAPWSFTTTKTINYTDEHPFVINDDLIDELSKTAEKQTLEAVKQSEVEKKGLKVIANKTICIRVNGYNVAQVEDQRGREVEVSHITALADQSLLDTIKDATEKILPKATLSVNSFMYVFYDTLRQMHPDTSEVCLVDITSEATELAIVRDGILRYTTHIPYGSFTLTREIAQACKLPKEEVSGLLKDNPALVLDKLAKDKIDQIAAIFSTYQLKISSLFHETGDALSIPKTIFLHCDLNTEEFFTKQLKGGAKEATGSDHSVHNISSKLFKKDRPDDTALLLSAHHFHLDTKNEMP